MADLSLDHPLAFAFGIIGSIISFMVYLAPLPTFYRVYRMRSTEGFQSVPYVVALFSAMLWIYYAIVKTDATLLITINAFGCFIETFYTAIYLIYAPRAMRRLVVRTRSVEYMPFYLSLFLTISAVAWFAYGLLIRDLYVLVNHSSINQSDLVASLTFNVNFFQLPNILGLIFGATQMVLYVIVSTRQLPTLDPTMPEHVIAITVVPLNSTLGIEPNQFENRFEMIECNHENSCSADKANHDDTGKAATEDISSGMNGGA
ncbi:hypothetical protein ZIOFF_064671 [Zingiber officinale]|uniref:Bidirectional sugar transporter SWEET n=1 Tax=Zingiber officinale TaxID=94328 RepID=A0A8J5EW76_ZINOF|nr:hypothetical protein ZIOFF_064671 [Zingiber officinale]